MSRVVLTYLRKNDTVGLSELVQHLARKRANAARRGPTAADEELSRVELFHIDIPLLADLELITYGFRVRDDFAGLGSG